MESNIIMGFFYLKRILNRSGMTSVLCLGALLYTAEQSALQARPDPVEISQKTERISIGPSMEFLKEDKGPLELESVEQLPDSRWKKQKLTRVYSGVNTRPTWYRFTVKHPKNESEKVNEAVLTFLGPSTDHIELYLPRNTEGYVQKITGNIHNFNTRGLQDRYVSFRIPVLEGRNYYLRLNNIVSYEGGALTIFSVNSYYLFIIKQTLILGLYFGFLSVMCLYNLFIFFSVREKTFFYYSCFIFLILSSALALEGVGFQYFYPNAPWFQIHILLILGPLTLSFALLFTAHYLKLAELHPRSNKIIRGLTLLHLTQIPVFVLVLVKLFPEYVFILSNSLVMITVLYLLGLGVYLTWQGERSAKFYLIAWSFSILGILIRFLVGLEVVPRNNFTNWSYQFGGAMEVTLLSFGLADRINTLKNNLAQANEELEEKVLERTRDLEKSLTYVQELKKRQDGDYFLTSQLIKPLGANNVKSKNVKVDFLTRQKKRFTFRGIRDEIGGDLCVAENITLRTEPYTVFLNGDAMGKSLQGAGGALVLGSVFESIVERTRETGGELSNRNPADWLKNSYRELHRIFETFDGGMLISIVLGLLEEQTGVLYLLNADHPQTVIYRNSKAQFLEDRMQLSKLGTLVASANLDAIKTQLEPDDIIIVGSDGRDDLALKPDKTGERRLINDDDAFLRHVETGQGNLPQIFRSLRRSGGFIDDISLISVKYIGPGDPDVVET